MAQRALVHLFTPIITACLMGMRLSKSTTLVLPGQCYHLELIGMEDFRPPHLSLVQSRLCLQEGVGMVIRYQGKLWPFEVITSYLYSAHWRQHLLAYFSLALLNFPKTISWPSYISAALDAYIDASAMVSNGLKKLVILNTSEWDYISPSQILLCICLFTSTLCWLTSSLLEARPFGCVLAWTS